MKKYLLFTVSLLCFFSTYAQKYDENEKEALRKVLRLQKTDYNYDLTKVLIKNFERFGLTEADTLTWYTSEEWVEKLDYFKWNDDQPKRMTEMNITTGLRDIHYDLSPFTELESLSCSIHLYGISYFGCSFDISKNKKLKNLSAHRSSFTENSFSEENCIEFLRLSESDGFRPPSSSLAKKIDLKKFPKLKYFYHTTLVNYDFSNCPLLEKIWGNIPLDIDLSKNTKLKTLILSEAKGGTLNLSANMKELEEVKIYNVYGASSINFGDAPKLKEIYLSWVGGAYGGCQIDWGNLNLEKITINHSGPISKMDLSQMTNLKYLDCNYNSIESLDISGCTNLEYLNCRSNSLTSLVLPENNKIDTLICGGNSLEFSTLPLQNIENYNYSTPFGINYISKDVYWKNGIDLSKEYNIDGYITKYIWHKTFSSKDENKINLMGKNGKFELTKDLIGERLYCTASNERFPDLVVLYCFQILRNATGINNDTFADQTVSIQSSIVNKSEPIIINSEAGIRGTTQLYNMQGKLINLSTISEGTTEMIAPASAGIYLLNIKTDDGSAYSFKILVR